MLGNLGFQPGVRTSQLCDSGCPSFIPLVSSRLKTGVRITISEDKTRSWALQVCRVMKRGQ